MEPNKDQENSLNNLESENRDFVPEDATKKPGHEEDYSEDDTEFASEDKYLALEQPGVSYTEESNPSEKNSDNATSGSPADTEQWSSEHPNSRNSEAFNQDDYILNDNVDLDEDQSQSISSEDDLDTNTTDEIL